MRLVSNGLADEDYCRKLGQLVPELAQSFLDHEVKLNHHDEKNALLELNTDQHFVFPEGDGNAIIQNLFGHITKFDNCDILLKTAGVKLLTSESGGVNGVKFRGMNGLLRHLHGKNVMLACGGFEGNREMLTKGAGTAGTAGAFNSMHCELDTRATKSDAVITLQLFALERKLSY
ncbi:hypothetical protein BKA65DRAFT_535984 [Rhexocercosporidium sp. MPI-PUGE-AT-0058]|nr:hypothetical protein BKA65DRAFT_535984 [Rhexocercosporidium sp. MPI-PUGE-AT-0058]